MTLTTLSFKNAIRYKEKENAFIKSCKCGLFSVVFSYRTRRKYD